MTLLQRGDFVSCEWFGKAVVCIASGPSLTQEQVDLVRDARAQDLIRVIAVNDNYLIAPFADVLYYADEKWANWHESGIRKIWPWVRFSAEEVREAFAWFRGQKCTLTLSPPREGLFRLKNMQSDGLSLDPFGVATGSNSGHQALNVAALSGGRPVLLLGYDGARGPNERKHAFGEHKDRTEPKYHKMVAAMRTTAGALRELGVDVLNCSPGSAIDAFPKVPLKAALEGLLLTQAASAIPA